jgi:peroxiredoxin
LSYAAEERIAREEGIVRLGDTVEDFSFLRSDGSAIVALSSFSAKALLLIFLRHLG